MHPKLPGDVEDTATWDAVEALALAKALGWRVAGAEQQPGEGVEASAGSSSSEGEEAEEEEESEEERSALDISAWLSDEHIVRLERVDHKFFFPLAVVARIAVRVARTRSDVLFVNAALSPSQQRHLEAAMDLAARARRRTTGSRWRGGGAEEEDGEAVVRGEDAGGVAVFDRPRAVLAIFARRATSPLAKLRVELAEAQQIKAKLGASAVQGLTLQLQRVADALARSIQGCDQAALLPRSGTARGVSTSFCSSPQTTRQKQQRAVEEKERRAREELARLQSHRGVQRERRRQLQTIGLVGYTNVGKSAIVNRLTGSDLLVRDGVFVTLDIAARRVPLPSGAECYVLDSVGLVKDLPLELCEAFQATVEELRAADLVLHVRDMSHPSRQEHRRVVMKTLKEADIDIERRVIEVWNKSDLISAKEGRHFFYIHQLSHSTPVYPVSALRGDGFPELLVGMESRLQGLAQAASGVQTAARRVAAEGGTPGRSLQRVRIPQGLPADAAAERWRFLREHCAVVEESISQEEDSGGSTVLDAWMDDAARARCVKRFGDGMLA